jgi:ribonuclease Z
LVHIKKLKKEEKRFVSKMSNSLVRFFGTSAAAPSLRRGFSCIGLVEREKNSDEDQILLLDCGDGSIRKIMETKTNCLSISDNLITHFHSDHLSGLAQVIESMDIQKRTRDLNVFGPNGLKEYFAQIERTTRIATKRKFQITINELDSGTRAARISNYNVSTFEMRHTIPCLGYRIESPSFTLAYTGDTEPCNEVSTLAQGVDLLIHEATFLRKDVEKARSAKHSTPLEAAQDAKKGFGEGIGPYAH